MAARVFVYLFNQRGASLQQRILELLCVADAADEFHKKTVSAAVGGGVASVAGSVATITGLILAPFTFGASIIVTAVGISVATAGSITSATANITDTVHSNMDRKKVLGAAGGAAKAAQAISITTGVMSALFLALDVFFLAKDSHELRKGAKTKFAGKIREVCKDLQDGVLELNKVKTQLQKTMDGIEVEEYEEIEEVEVEVEDELESDPKKLAELEQEIDFLEEKLDKKEDKKEDLEQKKSKETLRRASEGEQEEPPQQGTRGGERRRSSKVESARKRFERAAGDQQEEEEREERVGEEKK
ncbi:hypothetical protein XENOCAPTIV_025228 [Xenoophorus captivus]|uniref:Uncharacterized protein n=1 Tax=Xenoophorus captivus TaxID=1517983 RepID=A0ABV0RWS3_9TELE